MRGLEADFRICEIGCPGDIFELSPTGIKTGDDDQFPFIPPRIIVIEPPGGYYDDCNQRYADIVTQRGHRAVVIDIYNEASWQQLGEFRDRSLNLIVLENVLNDPGWQVKNFRALVNNFAFVLSLEGVVLVINTFHFEGYQDFIRATGGIFGTLMDEYRNKSSSSNNQRSAILAILENRIPEDPGIIPGLTPHLDDFFETWIALEKRDGELPGMK